MVYDFVLVFFLFVTCTCTHIQFSNSNDNDIDINSFRRWWSWFRIDGFAAWLLLVLYWSNARFRMRCFGKEQKTKAKHTNDIVWKIRSIAGCRMHFCCTGACVRARSYVRLRFRLFRLFGMHSILKQLGQKLRGHCAFVLVSSSNNFLNSRIVCPVCICCVRVFILHFSLDLAWKRRNWCLSQSFCSLLLLLLLFLFLLLFLGFYCVRSCVCLFGLNMRQTFMIFPTEIDLSYVEESTKRI